MAAKDTLYDVTFAQSLKTPSDKRIDYGVTFHIQEVGASRPFYEESHTWYDVPDAILAANINPVDYLINGWDNAFKKWLPHGVVIDRDFKTVTIRVGYIDVTKIEKKGVDAIKRSLRLGTIMSYTLPKTKKKK